MLLHFKMTSLVFLDDKSKNPSFTAVYKLSSLPTSHLLPTRSFLTNYHLPCPEVGFIYFRLTKRNGRLTKRNGQRNGVKRKRNGQRKRRPELLDVNMEHKSCVDLNVEWS